MCFEYLFNFFKGNGSANDQKEPVDSVSTTITMGDNESDYELSKLQGEYRKTGQMDDEDHDDQDFEVEIDNNEDDLETGCDSLMGPVDQDQEVPRRDENPEVEQDHSKTLTASSQQQVQQPVMSAQNVPFSERTKAPGKKEAALLEEQRQNYQKSKNQSKIKLKKKDKSQKQEKQGKQELSSKEVSEPAIEDQEINLQMEMPDEDDNNWDLDVDIDI